MNTCMILGNAKRHPSALSIPCQLQGVFINSQLFWVLSSSWVTSGQPNTCERLIWQDLCRSSACCGKCNFPDCTLGLQLSSQQAVGARTLNGLCLLASKSQSLWLMLSVTKRHRGLGVSLKLGDDFFSHRNAVSYIPRAHTTGVTPELCINLGGICCFFRAADKLFPDLRAEQRISLTWLLFMLTWKVRTSSLKEFPHFKSEVFLLMSTRHCWCLKNKHYVHRSLRHSKLAMYLAAAKLENFAPGPLLAATDLPLQI